MQSPRSILRHFRDHLPRRTVRLRLTAVYGGLFLVSGAALLTITDSLWSGSSQEEVTLPKGAAARFVQGLPFKPPRENFVRAKGTAISSVTPRQIRLVGHSLVGLRTQQQASDLHELIIYSAIAIAIMAVLSIVLGWLMAGRVLRPLRTITSTARDISATNLHERLELSGPDDELKELGDTFDRLLERLDASFQSQRQFVANASHELRTPLATMRASIDVAVAKPGELAEQTAALADRLRDELDQIDRLLDSLLALARGQRGPIGDEAVLSLDDAVSSAIERRAGAISYMDLELEVGRCPDASIKGSQPLISRLVENVIDNAITHNRRGGWLKVRTEVAGGSARLVVENGGEVLDDESVQALVQPFRRLGAARTGSDGGTGLGLSIVSAIAEAHDGTLQLHPLSGGGLQVVIDLPLAVRTLEGVAT